MKKIIALGVLLIVAFSFAACGETETPNTPTYKDIAKTELAAYVLQKGEDNYFEEDWELIEWMKSQAEVSIDEATDESEVENVSTQAKQEINTVPKKDHMTIDETILERFDAHDQKEYYTEEDGVDFELNKVCVKLRKTSTYEQLELEHFNLIYGQSIEYIWQQPLPYSDESFRQYAVITLNRSGRAYVLNAVKKLQRLEFVKLAEPDIIHESDPDVMRYHRVATLDDDFKDDCLTVMLKYHYSQIPGISLDIFQQASEIEFEGMKDLAYETSTEWENEIAFDDHRHYHEIVLIKLKTPGKENVLKAIEDLKKMTIVLCANPEYNQFLIPHLNLIIQKS